MCNNYAYSMHYIRIKYGKHHNVHQHKGIYDTTVLLSLLSCVGPVVLTQTHPAATYVCRTGITLPSGVSMMELGNVLTGGDFGPLLRMRVHGTTNPPTIPGHTALPHTTTYQEVYMLWTTTPS